MAEGTDRREVTQDANQVSKTIQAGHVQGTSISGGVTNHMNGLRTVNKQLSDAFGSLGEGMNAFFKGKQSQWEIQGKLDHAEGKTESELKGNRYYDRGYKGMEMKVAGDQFFQSALADIDMQDKELPPEEFKKKLMEQFKTLNSSVDSSDDDVKALLAAQAEEIFPKLMSVQMKANNAFKEGKTFDAYRDLLVSTSVVKDPTDPESSASNVRELFDLPMPLSEERKKQAITEAGVLASKQGDKSFFKALGLGEQQKQAMLAEQSGLRPAFHAAVLGIESGGRRYGDDGKLLVSSAGAKGEMQVMDATKTNPGYGVIPAKDDSPEELARVGRDYLAMLVNRYGDEVVAGMAYNAGPGAMDSYIERVGSPIKGTISHADFIRGFGAEETRKYGTKLLTTLGNPKLETQATDKYAMYSSMSSLGLSTAQMNSLSGAYDDVVTEESRKFDRDRFGIEQQVQSYSRETGNYDEALNMIETAKSANGYTDEWANKQAAAAASTIETYRKERAKNKSILAAVTTDNIKALPADQQGEAIEMLKAQINGASKVSGLDPEKANQEAQTQFMNALIKQDLVDPKMTAMIASNFTRNNIIDEKTGEVKDDVMDAYSAYAYMRDNGNPGQSGKLLTTEDAKKFAYSADNYSQQGMNVQEALKAASIRVYNERKFDTSNTPSPIKESVLREKIDAKFNTSLKPSFLAQFRSDNAALQHDFLDGELDTAWNNVAFKSFVVAQSKQHYGNAPELDPEQREDYAVSRTLDDITARSDFVAGNFYIADKGKPKLSEQMGPNVASLKNGVHRATLQYVEAIGKEVWGDKFTNFQILPEVNNPPNSQFGIVNVAKSAANVINAFGPSGAEKDGRTAYGVIGKSIDQFVRGVPQLDVQPGPDGSMMIRFYEDVERKHLSQTPIFVSPKTIGAMFDAKLYGNEAQFQNLRLQELAKFTKLKGKLPGANAYYATPEPTEE